MKWLAFISMICKGFNLKRDAYYKYKCRADQRKKVEFYLDQTFMNTTHGKRAAKNAIKLYNEEDYT